MKLDGSAVAVSEASASCLAVVVRALARAVLLTRDGSTALQWQPSALL